MNDKLSEKVIGAAFKVHNTLGFGQYRYDAGRGGSAFDSVE